MLIIILISVISCGPGPELYAYFYSDYCYLTGHQLHLQLLELFLYGVGILYRDPTQASLGIPLIYYQLYLVLCYNTSLLC